MVRREPSASVQGMTFHPSTGAAARAVRRHRARYLVDVAGGVGAGLPAAQEGQGLLGGHVQIEHQIGPGEPQLGVLKVIQPAEKLLPLVGRQLAGLVDGVGSAVPVGEDQSAPLIITPPHLFPGGVAVHREKGGGGIGVHVGGVGAELPAQIHPDEGGGGLAVLRKDQTLEGTALLLHPLTQTGKLGGLARAIGPFEYN